MELTDIICGHQTWRQIPAFGEFFVQERVGVEINCFMYEMGKKVQNVEQVLPPDPRDICPKNKDTFKITVDGVTEDHCRPFHHFSKYVKSKDGFILTFTYKRKEKYETKGKSFECSILGKFLWRRFDNNYNNFYNSNSNNGQYYVIYDIIAQGHHYEFKFIIDNIFCTRYNLK